MATSDVFISEYLIVVYIHNTRQAFSNLLLWSDDTCFSSQLDICSVLSRLPPRQLYNSDRKRASLKNKFKQSTWYDESGYSPSKHSGLFSFVLLIITKKKCDMLLIQEENHCSSGRSGVVFSRTAAAPLELIQIQCPKAFSADWWCYMGQWAEECKNYWKNNDVYYSGPFNTENVQYHCNKVTSICCLCLKIAPHSLSC